MDNQGQKISTRHQKFPVLVSRNRNTETLCSSFVSEPDLLSKFSLENSRNRNLDIPSLRIGTRIEIRHSSFRNRNRNQNIVQVEFLFNYKPHFTQKEHFLPPKSPFSSENILNRNRNIETLMLSLVSEPESEARSRYVESQKRNRNRVLDMLGLIPLPC